MAKKRIEMTVPQYILDPIYQPAKLPEHKNNPLIEALPPFRTARQMIHKFGRYPLFDKEERKLPVEDRMLMVSRLDEYLEPLPFHFEVIERIGLMIRSGYVHRNLKDSNYLKSLNEAYRSAMNGEICTIGSSKPSTAPALSLLGISGGGKTTIVERILAFLPQVIAHPEFGIVQVVWVKLECPKNGAVKPFMLELLEEIGNLVGTDYRGMFENENTDALISHVSRIAAMHHVGLIVIDEIQNLLAAKGTGQDELMNTLVKFTNKVKTPICMIGTPRAKKILQTTFREARRSGDYGSYMWTMLKKGRVLDFFIEKLWNYQWTSKRAPLADSIRNEFLSQSQGNTAVIVRLHQFSQLDAIREEGESVTAKIIKRVAQEKLQLIAPMIEAIKSGKGKDIDQYEDLFCQGLNTMKEEVYGEARLPMLSAKSDERMNLMSKHSRTISALITAGMDQTQVTSAVDEFFDEAPDKTVEEAVRAIINSRIPLKSTPEINYADSLKNIVKLGGESGVNAVDALAAAGIIKSAK